MRESYHAVFWFEVACAATALVILVCFVKIRKAESEFTVDERAELEAYARAAGEGGENEKEKEVERPDTA